MADRAEEVALATDAKLRELPVSGDTTTIREIAAKRLAIIAAALRSYGQWNFDMEAAPRDGTRIVAWCRHQYWQYAKTDEERAPWEGPVIAHWIDHNGGGWTWYGHSGTFIAWMLAPPLPSPPPAGGEK